MKRILILCADDWLAPRASACAHYLHQVARPIVGEGNFVAWLCSRQRTGLLRQRTRPSLESVDGIQIARLGPRFLYPKVAKIVVSRLKAQGKLSKLYDVILSGVTGTPVDLGESLGVPVIPVVFSLSPKIRGDQEPPGPVIATNRIAEENLTDAGFPDSHVIRAPFGAPDSLTGARRQNSTGEERAGGRPSTVIAWTEQPGLVLKAVESLGTSCRPDKVVFVGRKRPKGRRESICWEPRLDDEQRSTLYPAATWAYCGVGYEWESLALTAAGVPVVCAETTAAHEYVSDEETGLTCPPGDWRRLADSVARLNRDEVLRKRVVSRGREQAEAATWERTAGLVLAAIENLQ